MEGRPEKTGILRKETTCLAALIFLLTAVSFVLCVRKEGYYIDELWSYGLANSYEMPHLQNKAAYTDHWHDPSFYTEYLTVTGSQEAFAFRSVIYNQKHDVHPPLYYLCLHVISSLFPGRWSAWYGLLINLVFHALSLVLLANILMLLCGREGRDFFFTCTGVACYGGCAAALSNVLYIRMYGMLTFFVLLLLYLVLCYLRRAEEAETTRAVRLLPALALCTAGGFLTHYHFLFFLVFLTLPAAGILLLQKKTAPAFLLAAPLLIGGAVSLLLFPAALTHLFRGEKGQESLSAFSEGGRMLFNKILTFCGIASDSLFGIPYGWFLVFLGVTAAVLACVSLRKLPADRLLVTGSALLFFAAVSMTATDEADRYLFAAYPLIMLCLTVCVRDFAGRFPVPGRVLAVLLLLLTVSGTLRGRALHYLYPGYRKALETLESAPAKTPGIYLTKGDHLVINNALFLSALHQSYATDPANLPELPGVLKEAGFGDAEALVLFVDIYYDEDETAKEAAFLLGFQGVEKLYDNTFTQIYLLTKTS